MGKLFAIIFIALLPMISWAQSKKADEYFNKGMELVRKDKVAEALPFFEKSNSLNKEQKADTLLSSLAIAACCHIIADNSFKIGDYHNAIKFQIRTNDIFKKILGENDTIYATSLNNLANYYDKIGNYTEAIRLGSQALEIRRKVLGEEHPDYATSLNNLASYYDDIGNDTEAIKLGSQALEIRRKALGEKHPDYATSLINLANYNGKIDNYTKAIRLGSQALEIFKKALGKEHPDYATSLINLAYYNGEIGNYTEAIRLCTQALEIRKKALGEEHPGYAISLNNLAYYNFMAGNYDKSAKLYKQCFERKKLFILKNFASMTEKERANFWSTDSKFFSDRLPYRAYKHPTPTFATLAYNGQLLSKGLLLNAELEIQKLIALSGNKDFEKRYYTLRENRIKLDKIYQQPISQRTMNIDSLSAIIEKDERYLVEHIKELGDCTRNLSISWEDVQNKLSDKDITIEFAAAYSDYYVALVLKKGMPVPEIVNISFSEADLSNCYTNSNLYNAIWMPLEKYLQGVENVYFAPSGKFHTIAIEYLPDENGKIFAQKYNAYRLSSTRELAMEHKTNPNKKAATYGGIVYNFESADWNQELEKVKNGEEIFRDVPMINGVPEAVEYLPETRRESDSINSILSSAKYTVSAKIGKDATEGSFKALSGKGLKIMHISTHGFYAPEKDLEKSNVNFFLRETNNKEDRTLSCSGLYMAGANNTLDSVKVNKNPEGLDDGILTAMEISRLNFKGLDLVVLSACQTGLGEVTGEGVFGLQRGFKKAGAQTIVMSLWKVGEESSKIWMVEFFKNLAAGQSNREAFLSAQKVVRKEHPDPKDWAAFVMVDGVE